MVICLERGADLHMAHPKAHKKTSDTRYGTPYLTTDKSPVSEGEEHHVKNDNEIDEFHRSQLKF